MEVNLRALRTKTVSRDIVALLRKPTLRKVSITDNPKLVEAVSGSSILDLNLVLEENRAVKAILDTLQSLSLQRLTLECGADAKKNCCLGKEGKLSPSNIARTCPELTCIDLTCFCDRTRDLNSLFVEAITSLREITIRRPPSQHLVERLSTFQSVKVQAPVGVGSASEGIFMANQFPIAVTEIVLWGAWLSVEQVRNFREYPSLKKLKCGLLRGAEVALVEVCRSSPSLRTLQLEWEHDSRKQRSFYDNFESVVPGAVLSLVEAAPMLVNLCLSHVKIPTGELKDLLKALGSRVETFGTSTVFQEEEKFDRFMTIVETVIQNNPRLRELDVQNTYTSVQANLSKRNEAKAVALLACLRKHQPLLHVPGLPYPLNATPS